MTPAGIERVIFRFVAQHLNHRAAAVPLLESTEMEKVQTLKKMVQPF
jgi:hypothetical protein